jgi:hypothetical protein
MDPRKVATYNSILHKQLAYHKVFQKLEVLEHAISDNQWNSAHTQTYKALDEVITQSMLHAEHSISRRCAQAYDWSITLAQAMHSVRYWKLRIKQAKSLFVSDHILQVTHKLAGLQEQVTEPSSLPDLLSRLHAAKQHLEGCQKKRP